MGKTTKKQVDAFPLRTLCFCLASFWFPVRGLSLIGSSEPVAVAPGEDAVLPCRLDSGEDARFLTVEWSRPDLQRGAGGPQRRADVVFVLRGGREVRDVVLRAYLNRTSLLPGGARRGDLSLRISGVRPQDAGQYRCLLPRPGRHAHATLLIQSSPESRPRRRPRLRSPRTSRQSAVGRTWSPGSLSPWSPSLWRPPSSDGSASGGGNKTKTRTTFRT